MLRMNKKGFALIETLIVSVFVMTMFTLIYANFFPIMGEYERRQNYDDIDSIYKTFLVKRMIESVDFKDKNNVINKVASRKYIRYDFEGDGDLDAACGNLMQNSSVQYCKDLMIELEAKQLVITNYKLTDLKNVCKNSNVDPNNLGADFCDYVKTQPYFTNDNNNPKGFTYRIIVVYKRTPNAASESYKGKTIISYSTLGVVI